MNRTHPTCEEIADTCLGKGKTSGREVSFVCPGHDDNSPSLSINKDKNCWYCHPCRTGGGWWKLAAFIGGIDAEDKKSVGKFLMEKGL